MEGVVFGSLKELNEAVREAREAARVEAWRGCGRRGFLQSRGAEWVVSDSRGDKLNEGGVHIWDGSKKGMESDLSSLLKRYPGAAEAWLEGGFNWAASLGEMSDGSYDPLVSEWAVKVWVAPVAKAAA